MASCLDAKYLYILLKLNVTMAAFSSFHSDVSCCVSRESENKPTAFLKSNRFWFQPQGGARTWVASWPAKQWERCPHGTMVAPGFALAHRTLRRPTSHWEPLGSSLESLTAFWSDDAGRRVQWWSTGSELNGKPFRAWLTLENNQKITSTTVLQSASESEFLC